MKKLKFGVIALFIIISLIFAGCDNPAVKDFLGDFLGDSGINIKSGDSGSARISFNSDVEKIVPEWGLIAVEERGLGYYEFTDPDLKDESLAGYKIEKDENGLYVMYSPEAVQVITGYIFAEGPKQGEMVDETELEVLGPLGENYVIESTGEYYQVLVNHIYAEGDKKGQTVPGNAVILGPENARYVTEGSGKYIQDLDYYIYAEGSKKDLTVPGNAIILGPEGAKYVTEGSGTYNQVLKHYLYADGKKEGQIVPSEAVILGPEGAKYVTEGSGTYEQIITYYVYAEGPKAGQTVPFGAVIGGTPGNEYVTEGSGELEQILSHYNYAEGPKAGQTVPSGAVIGGTPGNEYVTEGSGTYTQEFSHYIYAEGPKTGNVVPGDAAVLGPEGGKYVTEGTGEYYQIPTGEYKYENQSIVTGKEVFQNDAGYYVKGETIEDWYPAEIPNLTIPGGNNVDFSGYFFYDNEQTPYQMVFRKTSGNATSVTSIPNNPNIKNFYYFVGNNPPADPYTWTKLPAQGQTLTGSTNGARLYVYAEVFVSAEEKIPVFPVTINGDEILLYFSVTPVYTNGAEIPVNIKVTPVYTNGSEIPVNTKVTPVYTNGAEIPVNIPVTPIYENGAEIPVDIPVTPVYKNGAEIPVDIPVTPVYVNGEEITATYIVMVQTEWVGGIPERKTVREITGWFDVYGYKDVVVIKEELNQDFALMISTMEIGSADFKVNPEAETLTITFKINDLILKTLEPQITCAWSKDENHVFETGEFIPVENLEVIIPYIPGEVVYIEANYLFQNIGL